MRLLQGEAEEGKGLQSMTSDQKLEFVVGAEKHLRDVLSRTDVLPLLQAAVQMGVMQAGIYDDCGRSLWLEPETMPCSAAQQETVKATLLLEGEPVGELRLVAQQRGSAAALQNMADLLRHALNSLISGNLKRILTTEMHTQVVNMSYEELLDANQRLQASEKKYRDLAANLDRRVQERTEELKRAYAQLIQQEKMASIGQLAAGIAHEINNPLGFVLSNLKTLQRYCDRFTEMHALYHEWIVAGVDASRAREQEQHERERLKIAVVEDDLADVFEESFTGVLRVKKIVADLKGFTHIDALGEEQIDLHQEIERVLSVLAHEIPAGTRITKNFSELPPLTCLGSQVGQLFLNLLRNAFQSRSEGLEVEISTIWEGHQFTIVIADNGPGIPDDIREKIFEPFFTTRDVGQGVGLGLSVAYDVVKELHGKIHCSERPGGGAVFEINLPEGK